MAMSEFAKLLAAEPKVKILKKGEIVMYDRLHRKKALPRRCK